MPLTTWLHSRATNNTNHGKPFAVPTSQTWDGDDGEWSTFLVRVGTPPQTFRVLPATNGDETWVPIPLGCTNASIPDPPSNCGDLRGADPFQVKPSQGFNTNASTSWQSNGVYDLIMEENLGVNGNGEYGFDTVALGDSATAPSLPHQVVAGIATSEFWLGSLGLGPKPVNFSASVPSLMANLASENLIPSLTFGYTAGAKYNTSSSSFGSLTLGGYDRARHIANHVTFDFDEDDSRSLTVGLQTITATNTLNGTVSIVSSPGIYALIDSGVPDLWLPRDACDIIAQAFGVNYDEASDRYLINDATHAKMDTLNPTVVFNIGPQANTFNNQTKNNDALSVAISLPYAAFVLQASYPLFPNATNYFPIRRAANETQYTIGRAFLQEAYITVDYARSKFHVSQAISSPSGAEDLIAITASTFDTPKHTHRITSSAIAGIVIGTMAFIICLLALLTMYFRRRRRRLQARQQSLSSSNDMTQLNPSRTPHSAGELRDLSNYLSPTSQDAAAKAEWEKSLERAMQPPNPRSPFSRTELESPSTTIAASTTTVFPKAELPTPTPAHTRPSSTKAELPTPTPVSSRPSSRRVRCGHQELPGSSTAEELEARRQAIYELPADDEWMAELQSATPRGSVHGEKRRKRGLGEGEVDGWRDGEIRRKERPRRRLVLQI